MRSSTTQRITLMLLAGLTLLAAGLTVWSLRRGDSTVDTVETVESAVPDAATISASAADDPQAVDPTPPSTEEPPVAVASPATQPGAGERAAAAPGDAAPPPTSGAPTARPFVELVTDPIDTLNPILADSPAERSLARKLFPLFVTQDPQSGLLTPDGLAESWAIAATSDRITFTLRSGVTWSDGTPVTAQDVAFTFGAIADPQVASPYRSSLAAVAAVTATDPGTVAVSLNQPDCSALQALVQPVLPSHRYAADFGGLADSPLNRAPTTTAGPFRFDEQTSDGAVRLVRDDSYWRGAPNIQTYHLVPAPTIDVQIEALQAGSGDLLRPLATDLDQFAGIEAVDRTRFPDDSYSFIALNLADPANPLTGQTTDEARQLQPPHPILGDLRVRQALAAALDYATILQAAYGEAHYRTGSYVPPTAQWVHDPTLQPPTYDPEQAAALLDEAGWTDEDGDGTRSREGTSLALTLLTNNDSPRRVAIAELVAAQLGAIGVTIRREALPFDAMSTRLLDQRYDLAVLGWDNLGADPGTMPFWHSREDRPGQGFNFVSFQDEAVDAWLDEARRMPGCDPAGRAALYRQVQSRVHEQLPYILLGGPQAVWLASAAWAGIAPGPWSVDYNVEDWRLVAE
jgi:peptide/nickel transport system substrate-binding protein